MFLEDNNIPATNNVSEHALRSRVTKMEVSDCFRRNFCTYCNDIISSVIETVKKQKVSI